MNRANKIYLNQLIEDERLYLEKLIGLPVKLCGSYKTGEFIYPYSDIDLKIYYERPTDILLKLYEYLKINPLVLSVLRNNEFFYLFIFNYYKESFHFQLTIHGKGDEYYDYEKEKKRKYYLMINNKKRNEFLQAKKQLYKLLELAKKNNDEEKIQYFKEQLYKLKKKYFSIYDLNQEVDIKYNLGKLDMENYKNDNLFILI